MMYFGTDGIRGRVGESPMTAEFALRLANASAQILAPNGGAVLIGAAGAVLIDAWWWRW